METESEVAVEYVEPAIPIPDSALFARAARLQAEDMASRRRITRHIDADDQGTGRLWIVLGDSIQLWVEDQVCNIDVCSGHVLLPPDAAWAVDDPAVATLRFVDPDVPGWTVPQRKSRAFLHGMSPGRTVVRATGLESPRDTLMARG